MMPPRKLFAIVAHNAVRNRRQFLLSVFGIVVGIAAFVFFLALSAKVREVVLGQVFPLERVEVVAPRASFLGVDTTAKLNAGTVAKIRAQPEVREAVPRMALAFPASGFGTFEGQRLTFEVGGFADGIDPGFLKGDARLEKLFQDWESPAHKAEQVQCGPPPTYACPKPDVYYCNARDHRCHHRVPVLISPTLVQLYNGQFATSHGLPIIDKSIQQFIIKRGGLSAMRFTIGLGETMVTGSNLNIKAPPREVQAVLVGVSDKSMALGMTMPIQYVRRWNREYAGKSAASTYSSIMVMLKNQDDVAPFAQWLHDKLNLRLKDRQGERFATAIFIITALFVVISVIIMLISAINIAHNFFMQVSERRREIGILRALGATRGDVSRIFLTEAALIGLVGGLVGIGVAYLGSLGVDFAAAHWLPNFPFKPHSFFHFEWWILAGALAFSILFCVLGGLLPARKAARMEPAQALAQQ